jgi:alkylation response protein AidB-like acyl-CoA dehydrogenase
MGFMAREKRAIDRYLPGLDERLAGKPLLELEGHDSPAIALYREAGGAGLLIPEAYGGLGADPVEGVRIQVALGSRAPSLAVATTMHQFSVATLVLLAEAAGGDGLDLIRGIARDRLLVASGFAEGRSGSGILSPAMRAVRTPGGGFAVSGSKKPCSLSRSMHLLTASVALDVGEGGPGRFAVLLVPADAPGIERKSFWASPILAGAESDEIILREVCVPEHQVFHTGESAGPDPVQVQGFIWFELLITASYVGIAAALVERAIRAGRGAAADRADAATEVEAAIAALEGVAREVAAGECTSETLTRALCVRYATQRSIARASTSAAEAMGGLTFIRSPEVAYLLGAIHALAFHPPARSPMAGPLADCLAGAPLMIA